MIGSIPSRALLPLVGALLLAPVCVAGQLPPSLELGVPVRVAATRLDLADLVHGRGGPHAPLVPVPSDLAPTARDYLAGTAAAVGMGALTGGALAFLGSQLGDPGAQENPAGVVGSIALGGLGYTAGCVLGAYLVGRRRYPKDSVKSTVWGGVIGMLAGTAVGFAQPGDNLGGIYLPLALLGPPVGAVVGFFR